MKKLITAAALFLFGITVFSQTPISLEYIPILGITGMENLVVEKITPSAAAITGGVPADAITYRVFIDMEDDYLLLGYTGNDASLFPFKIESTEPFFNFSNLGVGGIDGSSQNSFLWAVPGFEASQYDSYGADGRIGTDYVGIPYDLDTLDGTVNGITPLTPESTPLSSLIMPEAHPVFVDDSTTSMSNLNGGMFIVQAHGPTSDNMVFVMQLTTVGELSFMATVAIKEKNVAGIIRANHVGYNMSMDATLSDLKVDNATVAQFDADSLTYIVKLPEGSAVPVVSATANDDSAKVVITQASGFPGQATVLVRAEDFLTERTYTVIFSAMSSDATLSDLKIGGTTVSGFHADTTSYTVLLPADAAAIPEVTVTPNDAAASYVVTPNITLPGTTTVVVTAEDGITQLTYSISFDMSTGISVPGADNISVFANNGLIHINCDEAYINSTIEVYDITGRTLVNSKLLNTKEQLDLNAATGLFFVKISSPSNNQVITKKLIVQ